MGFSLNRSVSMLYCCVSRCSMVCKTQEQLRNHSEQMHAKVRNKNMRRNPDDENVFRCPICLEAFPTEKRLQIHLEEAYDPTFQCDVCRRWLSKQNAIQHGTGPCRAGMHHCSCGYSTPYTSSMKRHIRLRGCPIEGNSLRNYNIKPRKSRKSDAEPLHKCQYCEKCFYSTADLQKHSESELSRALAKQEARKPGMQIEGSTKKQYTCSWCNTITDDSIHLVHCMIKAEKDTGENVGHICSICSRNFKNYNKYLEHRINKVCSLTNWATCEPCGMRFPTRRLLRKHRENTHGRTITRRTAHGNIECSKCHQRFVTKFTLKRHWNRLHVEEETCDATAEQPVL